MRPDWSFVMVGPVVKISEDDLPKRPNIHYLGGKTYDELPGLSVGLGRRADAVRDERVDRSSSRRPRRPNIWPAASRWCRRRSRTSCATTASSKASRSPSTPEDFVAACEQALELARNPESGWLAEADLMLSATSWDTTQARMAGLIAELLGTRSRRRAGAAGGGGMNAPFTRREAPLRLSDRRRRLRRLGPRRAAGRASTARGCC